MSSSAASAPTHRAEPPKEKRVFRTDVHGLRGLAVFLVVVYHVFVGRVSGGVDVFLFISAYFLTGTFVRRMETGKPIAAVGYWGRTFKRLLPPTVVVTFAILAATYLFLPASTYVPMLKDAFFTLIQGENWWLINQATDYYAADRTVASPFQHFWSLSIQGQVFLAWPLLFALLALGLKAFERRFPPKNQHQHNIRVWSTSGIAIGAVTLASFIWSVVETAQDQQTAYFDTFARFWEFGLGGLVAIALPLIAERTDTLHPNSPKGRPWRFALSMVGVLALVSMGMLVDVAGKFPGWLAIWPLGAAAFVMIMGYNPILSSKPLQKLGGISYGLYLAHWPLLVLTLQVLEIPKASFWLGVVLVIASLGLAWLITKFVDTPFRRWKWAGAKTHRSVGVAVATVVIGLIPVVGAQALIAAHQAKLEKLAVINNPGARTIADPKLYDPTNDPNVTTLPTEADLPDDWFDAGPECEEAGAPDTTNWKKASCRTSRKGPITGKNMLVVIGSSRMEQTGASILPTAQKHHWDVMELTVPGCAVGMNKHDFCEPFTSEATQYLLELQPSAIALQTTFVDENGHEVVNEGALKLAEKFSNKGIRIIATRDIPRLKTSPSGCAIEHKDDPSVDCVEEISPEIIAERPDRATISAAGYHALDLNRYICPEARCEPIIGNMYVFLDANHITASYSKSMAEIVDQQLGDEGFRW
ncbi:acyltransferase [Dermabacter sp. p3-SID358]|uniref:acyltransferase family protein n=1 Tax=Dermabacter sp. p3-SID358 TaxID=2916114 RepID=UPI0021A8BE5D|nr:acyltransferase family protein [Dermabacter sp. p3-SID358]MCT1866895.1 acyltransferase [Dermabacter sp. p3-SID358]